MAFSTTPDGSRLFGEIRDSYPEQFRENAWYLTTVSSLVASGGYLHVGALYSYLTNLPAYQTQCARITLSNRLRDCLMKTWVITGIAPVLSAFFALVKAEKVAGILIEPGESETTREGTELDAANDKRGSAFLDILYRENLAPIVEQMGRHGGDIMWLERNIIYGLFLADFRLLTPVETSLVTFPALMCSGIKGATGWHIRGAARLGVPWTDVKEIAGCVSKIAEWVAVNNDDVVPADKNRGRWTEWVDEMEVEATNGKDVATNAAS